MPSSRPTPDSPTVLRVSCDLQPRRCSRFCRCPHRVAICRIGRETDDRVALALALTVRALRMGSVCIDLDTVHAQVHDESDAQLDVTQLPWPNPEEWRQAVMGSALVATEPDEPPSRPLRLAHGLLYLERYWQQEELVRRELQGRFGAAPPQIDKDRLVTALHRLFPGLVVMGLIARPWPQP